MRCVIQRDFDCLVVYVQFVFQEVNMRRDFIFKIEKEKLGLIQLSKESVYRVDNRKLSADFNKAASPHRMCIVVISCPKVFCSLQVIFVSVR